MPSKATQYSHIVSRVGMRRGPISRVGIRGGPISRVQLRGVFCTIATVVAAAIGWKTAKRHLNAKKGDQNGNRQQENSKEVCGSRKRHFCECKGD
ncbi:hypothetical protein O3M35_009484 [Rhynocoris fuscipes]|uniref:Transmembrane protein n=1 Tax=Rhynocoris fuscipes TaxID=488301 RepID=A0AAW1D6M5_9HEMI